MVDAEATLGICSHTLLTVSLQVAILKTVNRIMNGYQDDDLII